MRVHGAFASDDEVIPRGRILARKWSTKLHRGRFNRRRAQTEKAARDGDGEADPLYDQAVAFIMRTQKPRFPRFSASFASATNRSARLLEQMERSGVVSPMQSNNSREILVPNRME